MNEDGAQEGVVYNQSGMDVVIKSDDGAFAPRNWILQWLGARGDRLTIESAWKMGALREVSLEGTQRMLFRFAYSIGYTMGDLASLHVPAEDREAVVERIMASFHDGLLLGVNQRGRDR